LFRRGKQIACLLHAPGETIYLSLAGGDKSSQKRDIVLAKKLVRELEDSHD